MSTTSKIAVGTVKATWNITAAIVGVFILPLGYLMIGKPIRGLLVTLAIALLAVLTLGIGLLALPIAWLDIATGGKMG